MSVVLIVTYACAAVFAISVVARFIKISRLPIHLRWELYPVSHEKGRAHYGGSYLEVLDWWKQKRESSTIGELKVMIPEILLLAGVREHNKRHWAFTFPFHFGLYLLVGLIALLLAGGIASAVGVDVSGDGSGLGRALHHLTYLVGYAGLALAFLGSLALLARRTLNQDYREYTSPADYFNLIFFLVTLGVAGVNHIFADPSFTGLRAFFTRLVTFGMSSADAAFGPNPGLMYAEIILASLLVAYIPMTHMSHFFTKWFMYHDIRWGDEPNIRGGEIEKRLGEVLNYPVSWSATHIGADGKKTWADIATSAVVEEKTK